jgi:hypothetical protein
VSSIPYSKLVFTTEVIKYHLLVCVLVLMNGNFPRLMLLF